MIKARLSNKILLIINIFFILLFIIGTIIVSLTNSENICIGILCQIISFLYTSISYVRKNVVTSNFDENLIPIDNFIDRESIINGVIERLNNIIYENNHDKVIKIFCGEVDGVGKTELLLRAYYIFNNKTIAKNELDAQHYRLYKSIKKKIGYIYFLNNIQSEKIAYIINNKPYIISKRNLIFVDDCPQLTVDNFNEKSIIVFCQRDNKKLVSKNNKLIKLENFGKAEVSKYFQNKFQKDISDIDLERIMKYSQGNVLKISNILKTENSFITFCNNAAIIFEMEQYLNCGNYKKAREIVDNLNSSQKNALIKNSETEFEFNFLNADLTHLENDYQKALEMFEMLRIKYQGDIEKELRITEKISHVQKHLGNFKKALAELDVFPDGARAVRAVSLNLLEYTQKQSIFYLNEAEKNLHILKSDLTQHITSQKDSYHTYKAVTCIYDGKFSVAHNAIDKAISVYESNDSRFLNNCYYIKAEIYRHEGQIPKACHYYQRCLNAYRFNDDIDVYSMAFIMLTFLNKVYNANHYFEETFTIDEIKEICTERSMEYNKVLVMYLDELIKNETPQQYLKLKAYFDKYVFFIP